MRWRLLLEEYGPEIEQSGGTKNIVTVTQNRLPEQGDVAAIADNVDGVDTVLLFVTVDENIFPVQLKQIQTKQAKDRDLRQKIKTNPNHFRRLRQSK